MSNMKSKKKTTSKNGVNVSLSSNGNKPNRNLNQNVSRKDSDYYNLMINSSNPFILPDTWRCTHPYYQQFNLSSNSTPFIYVFRGGSLFDPDQTSTGAQPVGYDNFALLYNAWFVVGSQIEVTVVNNGTQPLQVALTPTVAASTITSFDQSRYYPRHSKFITVDGTSRGGSSHKRIRNQSTTLGFLSQPYDRDMQAQGGANPSVNWFWTIAIQSSDQSTLVSANIQVKLYYDTIWSQPLLVALS